jgi:hypothetical protein
VNLIQSFVEEGCSVIQLFQSYATTGVIVLWHWDHYPTLLCQKHRHRVMQCSKISQILNKCMLAPDNQPLLGNMSPNLNFYPHIILTQPRYPNTSPKRFMIRHPFLEISNHSFHSLVINGDVVRVHSVYLLVNSRLHRVEISDVEQGTMTYLRPTLSACCF